MIRKLLALSAVALFVTSCVTPDTRHRIVVSIPEQRLALLDNGALIATYPISTSKFTIGDAPGSRGTPLGELEIAKRLGAARSVELSSKTGDRPEKFWCPMRQAATRS